MADRYPLIINPNTGKIEELSFGDNLNLDGNSIVGASTITANKFVGIFSGTAEFANTLLDGSNIVAGTISSERLSGYYPISVQSAKELEDASNISAGIISSSLLQGTYDINITGTANTANFLTDGSNILDGIIPKERLSGTYDINITGTSFQTEISEFTLKSGISTNVIGGIASVTELSVSGVSTLGTVIADEYLGDGIGLVGIVTQLVAGIGIDISSTQSSGKGIVEISAYRPVGKTIYVTQNGNDSNSGLSENNSKRTIKSAASIALVGDTIKVFPGVYVEENPILLSRNVAVEGTELRNCVITPKYLDRDLFHVNNGCHITDLSFVGSAVTSGAAVVAFQPLSGVSSDRYFDASRMIRLNLDYIARESVGFLTSIQYIGAGRTQVTDPTFEIVDSSGNPTDPLSCADDIKDIFKSVIYDITRGGNSKCVGAGKSYYDENGSLLHITGSDSNGYSVKEATIDTIRYAADIARAVVNNVTFGGQSVGSPINVNFADYDRITGVTTITATSHNLVKNDAVKLEGLEFSCPSGPAILSYPTGSYGYTFNVHNVLDEDNFEVVVGVSTLPHYYESGGTIQKLSNFQDEFTQVKDLSMQPDPETGFNNTINSCANVISAIYSCVGIVTTIIENGISSGITTTYPGNSGIGFTTIKEVSNAVYDEVSGKTTLIIPNFSVKVNDIVEIYDLMFECFSGITTSTQKFPSGKYGNEFKVNKVNDDGSFDIYIGVSTLPHTYVSGGFVVDRSIRVVDATYDNVTGITTIDAPGAVVRVGDLISIRDLEFSCLSGAGTTTLYPTGSEGYNFKVTKVLSPDEFEIVVGTSTIPHTYSSGGLVLPAYSKGVGPVTQGPYVRNCTNFIPNSIGMKVEGFDAEPGDKDDIGVTGTMSVDSYTQYNQGGIGVSITNGAYAQLVSIFTICNNISVFTASGGQCDITNSNSSFGTYGLYADGYGNENTKSIYRSTGVAYTDASSKDNTITVSGLGTYRPYDGQVCYFGDLYNFVDNIEVTDGGFGYLSAPRVNVSNPEGENGITAQATTTIENGRVTSVNLVNSGTQYLNPPIITIEPPTGVGVAAQAVVSRMQPILYKVSEATLPSAGISTITLLQNLNNTVSAGTTVYFSRVSLQITSSHSFEWVGSGNDINRAKPALGGVAIQDNEVVQENGAIIVYTSTDQAGNFRIGDGVVINQASGTISGRIYSKSLFTTLTPFILALSD